MAVKINALFSMDDLKKSISEKKMEIKDKAIKRLIAVGEKFVNNARINGGYQNRTFNLVSSIAFAVLDNGNVIAENYKQIGDGKEGLTKAKESIERLISEYSDGLALIVVAGEDYAASVESKGKDVLTGSSIDAINELKKSVSKK